MKALILASGAGTRLKPLTNKIPKSLIKVNGEPIIKRLIDSLIQNKIQNLVITTGPFEQRLRDYIGQNYPQLKVEYVHSPLYQSTNYIYSMWLARGYLINTDVIYLHGDLFFDSSLMKKIISLDQSGALVNKGQRPQKDFKARIKDRRIVEIGVKVSGPNTGFCLPLFKLKNNDWEMWMDRIDGYIKDGKTNCYAEDAFNEISHQLNLCPVYFKNKLAMEIDDLEDLEKARKVY